MPVDKRWFAQLLLLIVWPCAAFADTVETFEGPDPTWTLAESDCQAQAVVHQRRLQDAHAGQGGPRRQLPAEFQELPT